MEDRRQDREDRRQDREDRIADRKERAEERRMMMALMDRALSSPANLRAPASL
eukprot:COSAG04_NODE_1633_length_6104_cov_3.956536_2_plen_53_part_00